MSKSFRLALLVIAIVFLIVGLALILWPDAARAVVCYVLGAAALAYGAFRIIWYFAHGDGAAELRFGVAAGIGCVVAGLFLLFRADAVVAAFAAVIGVAIVIDSVMRLQLALELRRLRGRYWLGVLISALVLLGAGVLLLFNPFTAVKAATIVAGVSLILDGALTLWSIFETDRQEKSKRTIVVK